jgi:hypothetical protein
VNNIGAKYWTRNRVEEVKQKLILTYCGGQAGFINRHAATSQLIDLIFDPQKVQAGKSVCGRAPIACRNRLRLKKGQQKRYPETITRERTGAVSVAGKQQSSGRFSLLVLCFLLTVTGDIRAMA